MSPTSGSPSIPGRAQVRAAGAIPWRERDGRLEVALVHRPRYKDWSWPKGKLDPGEVSPVAAAREVAEETGLQVVLGARLPDLHYGLQDGRRKVVHYWAAREADEAAGPALGARAEIVPASPTEIDGVVWVGVSTAAGLLTRRADLTPLRALVELWDRRRLTTSVLAVVRHGQARKRSDWDGGEDTRPLTGTGRRQAAALVPVLAAFGVRTVVTSPWERCVRTVRPYARAAGIDLEAADELTEAAYRSEPAAAVELVRRQMADPRDLALSTHRPVLPAVLQAVDRASRPWTTGRLPRKDPYLRTAEVLVVHVATTRSSPRVVAVERHRPSRDPD